MLVLQWVMANMEVSTVLLLLVHIRSLQITCVVVAVGGEIVVGGAR